ncbi:MAG TPA: ABC transporter permease subunit [Kofleriaceae bacterium]|jgi:ABC-2 type transport system permease protein|nr:ABC transporter permease subunit [Kofleriaceae bacterium]
MRAISIIYRRELGTYLRSPFGWVIAAILLLLFGIAFQGYAMSSEMLSAIVLERFFYVASGIPLVGGVLLSFRLLSEERQNHSMVLLNTSPVRDSDIVIGKYLAALTFLVIMLALSVYMPILIKINGKITSAQVLVGYIGLLLIGATTLAIGLFASSLTRQQLIAAVLAAAITLLLCFIHLLATKVDPPIKDAIEQVDLWWIHYQYGFMKGILNLKDVIFYLATTYFFLLLSTKTLEAKRWQ